MAKKRMARKRWAFKQFKLTLGIICLATTIILVNWGFAPHKESSKPHIVDYDASKIKHKFSDVSWEKTWLYDWYWYWQWQFTVDIPVLDTKWMYKSSGWIWSELFGGQNVVIDVFTNIA